MRSSIVLSTVFLYGFSMANYNIKLYKNPDCPDTIGQNFLGEYCKDMGPRICCARRSQKSGQQWSLWTSAKFEEIGGQPGQNTDQLKVYGRPYNNRDACSMIADQEEGSGTCVNHPGKRKEMSGAAVHVVVLPGEGSRIRRAAPKEEMKMVNTTEYFLDAGKTEYTLEINSSKGKEYEKLTTDKQRIDFLKKNGKKSTVSESSGGSSKTATKTASESHGHATGISKVSKTSKASKMSKASKTSKVSKTAKHSKTKGGHVKGTSKPKATKT